MEIARTRLIDERVRRGLTQMEVAVEVGYKSQSAVSDVERGAKFPSHQVMKRWADLYGMTVDELFFSPNEAEPDSSQATSTA